jgi:hypothetical protein
MAEQLDGKLAIATGTYAERRDGSRVHRILTAQTLRSEAEKGRGEYIDVTVHGTLKSGVIAIGAETTGVTITASAVTWELELKGNQHQVADKLNGSKAIVSGAKPEWKSRTASSSTCEVSSRRCYRSEVERRYHGPV